MQQQETDDKQEEQLGFPNFTDGAERLGWLLNLNSVSRHALCVIQQQPNSCTYVSAELLPNRIAAASVATACLRFGVPSCVAQRQLRRAACCYTPAHTIAFRLISLHCDRAVASSRAALPELARVLNKLSLWAAALERLPVWQLNMFGACNCDGWSMVLHTAMRKHV